MCDFLDIKTKRQILGNRDKKDTPDPEVKSRVAASSPSVFAENRGSTPKGGGGLTHPLNLTFIKSLRAF